jgi:glucose/arabinose dehydrogenase
VLRGRPLASGRVSTEDEGGVIKVLPPGGSPPRIFLDITARVLAGSEQGLLGQPDGATVIAEYRASAGDPNVADPTEAVFLVIAQPFANHNGGMVEFGPDGFLYIGMGDGGAGNDPGNRAQDINQLLGKMLRIDVDHPNGAQPYSSPPSNPFFGSVAGADEIYAYGFRNP